MQKDTPFVVPPKEVFALVGSERLGTYRFPVKYGPTQREQSLIEKEEEKAPDTYAEYTRLAVRISAEEKDTDLKLCLDAVAYPAVAEEIKQQIEQSDNPELSSKLQDRLDRFERYRIKYYPEIAEIANRAHKAFKASRLFAVTVFMLRVDPEWTPEKTEDLVVAKIEKIWEFIQQEYKGGDPVEAIPVTAEFVEKSLEKEAEKPPPTGQKSFGKSKNTGLQIVDSTPETSGSSLAG